MFLRYSNSASLQQPTVDHVFRQTSFPAFLHFYPIVRFFQYNSFQYNNIPFIKHVGNKEFMSCWSNTLLIYVDVYGENTAFNMMCKSVIKPMEVEMMMKFVVKSKFAFNLLDSWNEQHHCQSHVVMWHAAWPLTSVALLYALCVHQPDRDLVLDTVHCPQFYTAPSSVRELQVWIAIQSSC